MNSKVGLRGLMLALTAGLLGQRQYLHPQCTSTAPGVSGLL